MTKTSKITLAVLGVLVIASSAATWAQACGAGPQPARLPAAGEIAVNTSPHKAFNDCDNPDLNKFVDAVRF